MRINIHKEATCGKEDKSSALKVNSKFQNTKMSGGKSRLCIQNVFSVISKKER